HGNGFALQAVLEDIDRRGITQIVNLGDTADANMNPGGTIRLLMERDIPSVAGNYETFRPSQLSTDEENWLANLPPTLDLGDIFCCHGTPHSNTEALIETITLDHVSLGRSSAIAERLGDVRHPLVLCAHKHVPRTVRIHTGQMIVNPGSVGLPAYWNDEPCLHAVEAGTPHARYAILQPVPSGWDVAHVAVTYPWDLAAEMARQAGREDRAQFIATGRAEVPGDLLKAARLDNP
ncbi:MAG: metallophosphoesterase family protein, partial [Pseudomonadota bacterium]